MNPRLLVIADDLTGALDTGVQFAQSGVQSKVVMRGHLARCLRSCVVPVLVVDTESRHLAPSRAGCRVARCVRAARARGIERFFKKTDSTLRGNVGAELQALLSASGGGELFFVPALPRAGRVTRSGVLFVDGVPLHESPFASDPRDLVRGVSIERIIARQSHLPVVRVGRGDDPAPALAGRGRPLIVVFDAETDGDLEAIAHGLAAGGVPWLTAGCSGFAAHLPRLHDLPAGPPGRVALRPPLLVVSGSLHERSVGQVRQAELRGAASIDVDPRRGARRTASNRAMVGLLRERGTAIVRCAAGVTVSPRRAEVMLRTMGELAREIVDAAEVSTVAVFGGDTAFAVLNALDVHGLEPVREICQGTVVSRATRGRHAVELHLVTKAGGFGPPDVIDRIESAMERGV